MKIIGIIPARMASSRFPGKPLVKIIGIPMIGHVFLRSRMSECVDEVFVATCDWEIADYCQTIGAKAIMTKDTHQRATERAAEALEKIEEELKSQVDIVVMIQGDEPMVFPQMLDESLEPLLSDKGIKVVNLMSPLETKEEHDDPNTIKVVVDKNNFALYFSREPIPTRKKGAQTIRMFKQVCIIPFRRDFLLEFNRLQSMPLEIAESIDMLRILEHGYKVKMVLTKFDTQSVDTRDDLLKVETLMIKDPLFKRYV